MLGRLLIGIVKGLVVGGLLGFALVKLGMPMPGALVAYPAAAVTGIVIGLIAGKPIWAPDAKIEAGAKAIVGALLGVGLMAAARQWLMFPLPFALGDLASEGTAFGGFAMTSLAAIAALLGGFYDADNDSSAGDAKLKGGSDEKALPGKRVASAERAQDEEEELVDEPDRKHAKK